MKNTAQSMDNLEAPPEARALADREGDGGSLRTVRRDRSEREPARCLPALPPGHEAQPVWRFPDRTGRFSYEFNRVYGPPDLLDERGPTCQLDEDLSYWGVTWSLFPGTVDERPAGRWASYAQARRLRGPGLTFERFASYLQTCDELAELLDRCAEIVPVGGVSPEPRPALARAPRAIAARVRAPVAVGDPGAAS
jgi:hypothetical protein